MHGTKSKSFTPEVQQNSKKNQIKTLEGEVKSVVCLVKQEFEKRVEFKIKKTSGICGQ